MQPSKHALDVRTNCCNPVDNLSSKVKDSKASQDKSKSHILCCQNTYNQFSEVEISSIKVKTNLELRTFISFYLHNVGRSKCNFIKECVQIFCKYQTNSFSWKFLSKVIFLCPSFYLSASSWEVLVVDPNTTL